MRKFKNILIVDDNDTSNFLTEIVLEDLEIADNTTVKLNGKEALDYIRNCVKDGTKCPDLILLDLNMPIMDGFEFLGKLHSEQFKGLETDIIILTTSEYKKDIDRVYKYPIKGYIHKPLTEDKLLNVLGVSQ